MSGTDTGRGPKQNVFPIKKDLGQVPWIRPATPFQNKKKITFQLLMMFGCTVSQIQKSCNVHTDPLCLLCAASLFPFLLL